eukprot:g34485.t1
MGFFTPIRLRLTSWLIVGARFGRKALCDVFSYGTSKDFENLNQAKQHLFNAVILTPAPMKEHKSLWAPNSFKRRSWRLCSKWLTRNWRTGSWLLQ